MDDKRISATELAIYEPNIISYEDIITLRDGYLLQIAESVANNAVKQEQADALTAKIALFNSLPITPL